MSYVERFSDRAVDYARHRPSYPAKLLDYLADYGLVPGARVLDAGSGTGIMTELLLERGAEVFAAEPNAAMRELAEARLGPLPGFRSLAAPAEDTGVPSGSIDLIVAAQSFHWFDVDRTRSEWNRILTPEGWVALIWNETRESDPFTGGYRAIANRFVDEAEDGAKRRLKDPDAEIERFFGRKVNKFEFGNEQWFDLEGLVGRALSGSYWPKSGPAHDQSLTDLEALFLAHARDGLVSMKYATSAYLGCFNL